MGDVSSKEIEIMKATRDDMNLIIKNRDLKDWKYTCTLHTKIITTPFIQTKF